ncbi:MAG: sugar phosphate isomerase/epimerase [Victivallales bacterium]|nr:sugar phosphate isomerase/epimerase [Victivallales bacterium]
MKIATTTGDFSEYYSENDTRQILTLLADCGFKHIDLNIWHGNMPDSVIITDQWERWTDELGEAAAFLGLDFVQAHGSDGLFKECEDKHFRMKILKRELEICRRLGIRGMTVHGIARKDGERDEFMEANTAFYRELLDEAEKTGVMVFTENTCTKNMPTYFIYDGDDVNEICARLNNHPLFGCCWDVGHANIQGVDQYKAICTMGSNLKAVHIHDNIAWDNHLQPFVGNTNYDAILKGLKDIGFGPYFTLEAYSLPSSWKLTGRRPLELDGQVFNKLQTLPLSLKLRSERLMLDITRYMLETYGCYED